MRQQGRNASELARSYPAIKVDGDAIFLRDGKFWGSAGVTAGIDLTVALTAKDLGQVVAAAVARQLVVYLHRPGNQAQYSDPLSARTSANERFGDLLAEKGERVEDVARQVGYRSAASFRRAFERRFSMTPTQYQDRFDYPMMEAPTQ